MMHADSAAQDFAVRWHEILKAVGSDHVATSPSAL